MTGRFVLPTEVVYGDGAVDEIGSAAKPAGCSRAMIVTDPGVRKAGLVEAVEDSLRSAGVATTVYDAVSPNPRSLECYDGAMAMSRFGAELIVAVGGGSAIDAAKAMSVLCANGGKVEDYIPSLGGKRAERSMIPVYAVPTTCGTGAEVSPTAIITNAASGQKVTLRPCAPIMAFVDPMLALDMPPRLTASTGVDALSHAVEAYVSPHAGPYTDIFAVQAIRMIGANLRDAVEATGESRHDPMAAMMYAANLAGWSLKAGTNQIHSLAHALGGVLDVPHGNAVSIMLPAVLRYHLELLSGRLADVALLLGQDSFAMGTQEAAESAIDAISSLRQDVGLPGSLTELGVGEEHLARLADVVMLPDESDRRSRPRPCSRDDVLAMYRLAL
jgi:alcohol dehydrogenase class IV